MLLFNLGNLFADCRLGEVQSVSGPREIQFLGQNNNCVQVTCLNVGEHSPKTWSEVRWCSPDLLARVDALR